MRNATNQYTRSHDDDEPHRPGCMGSALRIAFLLMGVFLLMLACSK